MRGCIRGTVLTERQRDRETDTHAHTRAHTHTLAYKHTPYDYTATHIQYVHKDAGGFV